MICPYAATELSIAADRGKFGVMMKVESQCARNAGRLGSRDFVAKHPAFQAANGFIGFHLADGGVEPGIPVHEFHRNVIGPGILKVQHQFHPLRECVEAGETDKQFLPI